MHRIFFPALVVALLGGCVSMHGPPPPGVVAALARAGTNRGQIESALKAVRGREHEGMQFLVQNMPERDLTSLSASFLLDNVRLAYQAWDEAPWRDALPKDLFLNGVLPYASINERRDNWRRDFRDRFGPLVRDADSPSAAAALLNQRIFKLLNPSV